MNLRSRRAMLISTFMGIFITASSAVAKDNGDVCHKWIGDYGGEIRSDIENKNDRLKTHIGKKAIVIEIYRDNELILSAISEKYICRYNSVSGRINTVGGGGGKFILKSGSFLNIKLYDAYAGDGRHQQLYDYEPGPIKIFKVLSTQTDQPGDGR